MSRLTETVYTLTISSGQTVSNEAVIGGWLKACGVFAPGTLPETVSIQLEPTQDGSNWTILQSAGTDVTIQAGRALMIMEGAFKKLRMQAGWAVAADRVFQLRAVVGS